VPPLATDTLCDGLCLELEDAIRRLLSPSAEALAAVGSTLSGVIEALRSWQQRPEGESPRAEQALRIHELTRVLAHLLHSGATLRLGCGSLTFGQGGYTPLGGVAPVATVVPRLVARG